MKSSYVGLALCASCAASRPGPVTSTGGTPSGGDRVTTAAGAALTTALADAVEAAPMPTCEAGDLQAIATISPGTPAMAALARNDGGGLLAYLLDANHDGEAELMLQRIDDEGHSAGNALVVQTGARPAFPVLAARGTGYLLAWREGLPGHERIAVRAFDASGAASSQSFPTSALTSAWLGAPAIAVGEDRVFVSVVGSSSRPPDPDRRTGATIETLRIGAARVAASAPDGASFDGSEPPALIVRPGAEPRVFVSMVAPDTQSPDAASTRRFVELPNGASGAPVSLLDDVDGSAVSVGDRGLLFGWRTRVSTRDVVVRSWFVPDGREADSPPTTLATFRGAHEAQVAFAPVGEHLFGAFTISRMADDAGGSLNVSVIDGAGRYVGRQPILVSLLTRDARVVSSARGGNVWFALDARGDGGSGPVIAIIRVACDAAQRADRLQIPSPSMLQSTSVDEPRAELTSVPPSVRMSCTATAPPAPFVRHHSGVPYALAGTQAGTVTVAGATFVMAVSRPAGSTEPQLTYTTLDARGVAAPARTAAPGAGALLATGSAAGAALAVVRMNGTDGRTGIVSMRAGTRAAQVTPIAVVRPSSAAVAQDSATVFVVGESPNAAGDSSLFAILNAGRAAPVPVASLRPGDVVMDAMRVDTETFVLLARPDSFGADVARQLTVLALGDGGRAAFRGDPFADALGHGRGAARLVRTATGVGVAYADRNVVRWADIERREVRNPRSVLGTHANGGGFFGHVGSVGDVRWLGIASGMPEDVSRRPTPITLVALTARGDLRGVATGFPDEPSAIPEGAVTSVDGSRVTVVFARTERDGDAAWVVAQANCTLPAATPPRAATSPPTTTPATAPTSAPAGGETRR